MKKDRNAFFESSVNTQGYYPNLIAANNPYNTTEYMQSFYSGPVNPMNQNMNNNLYSNNELESRLAKIERQLNRLDNRISKLEKETLYSNDDYDLNNGGMYMV